MQLDLLARRTDPLSSVLAAEELISTGGHERSWRGVLFFLSRRSSITARELAYDMALALGETEEYWFSVTHKRLPDLRKRGLARTGELRKCRRGHRLAQTWWAV